MPQPMHRACLILGLVAGIFLNPRPSDAQYTANFQTNIISGVTSNWSGDYRIGGVDDVLLIQAGGILVNGGGELGPGIGNSSNFALVTGAGSVWSNQQDLFVGNLGSGNSLAISNAAKVLNNSSYIGFAGNSNSVNVGHGHAEWFNAGDLYVGYSGADNSLVVFDGVVTNDNGYVGFNSTSTNNTVNLISKTTWLNNVLHVGERGSGKLFMSNTAEVHASNLVIGADSSTCDNLVQLDQGRLIITNATHDAVLEVRRGQLILNRGTIQADILVMTNSCASLGHTGGTLIAGSVVLDPNAFRITSVILQGNDLLVTWLMGPGQTNTLQATAGDASGGYNTNGFVDIFVVTNNTTAGTATNYLDTGGATNVSSRYYRARLVP